MVVFHIATGYNVALHSTTGYNVASYSVTGYNVAFCNTTGYNGQNLPIPYHRIALLLELTERLWDMLVNQTFQLTSLLNLCLPVQDQAR